MAMSTVVPQILIDTKNGSLDAEIIHRSTRLWNHCKVCRSSIDRSDRLLEYHVLCDGRHCVRNVV